MAAPLVASIALCFVSWLGNFGIPSFLGIRGNALVHPTLTYQRLARSPLLHVAPA
jgi:ABC-type Fe3+ transport system permease subunit